MEETLEKLTHIKNHVRFPIEVARLFERWNCGHYEDYFYYYNRWIKNANECITLINELPPNSWWITRKMLSWAANSIITRFEKTRQCIIKCIINSELNHPTNETARGFHTVFTEYGITSEKIKIFMNITKSDNCYVNQETGKQYIEQEVLQLLPYDKNNGTTVYISALQDIDRF